MLLCTISQLLSLLDYYFLFRLIMSAICQLALLYLFIATMKTNSSQISLSFCNGRHIATRWILWSRWASADCNGWFFWFSAVSIFMSSLIPNSVIQEFCGMCDSSTRQSKQAGTPRASAACYKKIRDTLCDKSELSRVSYDYPLSVFRCPSWSSLVMSYSGSCTSLRAAVADLDQKNYKGPSFETSTSYCTQSKCHNTF